jgi:hypothetical protein
MKARSMHMSAFQRKMRAKHIHAVFDLDAPLS